MPNKFIFMNSTALTGEIIQAHRASIRRDLDAITELAELLGRIDELARAEILPDEIEPIHVEAVQNAISGLAAGVRMQVDVALGGGRDE
jgi:hypothetical protein